MSETTYRIFVQTSPGLEGLLMRELIGLGLSPDEKVGGVELRATPTVLWDLCLRSRLAESVRVRLKSFVARDFHALSKGLERLPFHAYIAPRSSVEVKVTCHRSRLWHTGAVAARTLEILESRIAVTDGKLKEGAARIHIRITGDAVQASSDAGGYRLHRRGYRAAVAKASLRETLAAAVILETTKHVSEQMSLAVGGSAPSAEGTPDTSGPVLWDPFCGAGTLAVEAAHWARGLLPGKQRDFSFQAWPTFDQAAFDRAKALAQEEELQRAPAPHLRAIGSDVSGKVLAKAKTNAEAAGVQDACTWLQGDLLSVAEQVPKGAWLVTNPPYGKRLADEGAVKQLVELCERRPDLRPCAVLVGGRAKKQLPGSFGVAFRTKSGGTRVTLRLRTA